MKQVLQFLFLFPLRCTPVNGNTGHIEEFADLRTVVVGLDLPVLVGEVTAGLSFGYREYLVNAEFLAAVES